jgi:hypothetical protein
MSVYGDGPEGRVMVAEMPVILQSGPEQPQLPPQRKVDEFWRKFSTKTPSKGNHPPFSSLFSPIHIHPSSLATN